jgi:4-hydroxybenzoate polyprenyltransferase
MAMVITKIGRSVWLVGPLAICFSSILLVAHATGRPITLAGVVLFFMGVIVAYSVDHWIDHPMERTRFLPTIASLAILAGLATTLWLPIWKIGLALALGCASLAYRQCKQWPLGKTLLVAGAWTAASVAFPVDWNSPERPSPPLILALFATFAANALLCDLKDVVADNCAGVRSAVVLWGQPATIALAAGFALAGALAALAVHRYGLAGAGVALCFLSAFPQWVGKPVLGPALVDCALVLPAVFILAGLA